MLKSDSNKDKDDPGSLKSENSGGSTLAFIKPKMTLKNYKIYKSQVHHLFLKKRMMKTIWRLDIKWGREINFSKFKKIVKNVKVIRSFNIEYGFGKNLSSFYSLLVFKCKKLYLRHLGFMQPQQLRLVARKIGLFKDLDTLGLTGLPPYKQGNLFRMKLLTKTLQSLSNLKKLTFLGQDISGIYPWPLIFKKSKLEYFNMTVSYFPETRTGNFPDLKLLKNFQLEIRDDNFSEDSLAQLDEWLRSMQEVKKGLISVSGSSIKFDMAPYIKYPFLEFDFKLRGRFSDVHDNLKNLNKIDLPISINWSVPPNECVDFDKTLAILKELSGFPHIKSFKESFQFQDNVSELTNCYPIWASIITHYSFQKIAILQLAIPVSEESIETVISVLSLSLPNMYNLEDLSITLNQEKSQEIKWYIQNSITDFINKLQKIEKLKSFEFNSEPDIMINYLNDFLVALTKMTQLKSLKSEWFQISPKSFKAFCNKMKSMKDLSSLDLHVYSLIEFRNEDLVESYISMAQALKYLPKLNKIHITADSNSFTDRSPWKICQDTLRTSFPNRIIDICVGNLEF